MLKLALIRTSETTTKEAMTFAGGSARKNVVINFGAVLIAHPSGSLLFDTGLGERIDEQYGRDMPRWKRPLLKYGAVDTVRAQLERAGAGSFERIVLSHGHWDHASGVVDFPQAEIWVTPAERTYLQSPPGRFSYRRGSMMPSQVESSDIRWHVYELEPRPFASFPTSLDLFGDGSAVLVSLCGHTPGSVGLFAATGSGKRFFFCGDAVWNASAIPQGRPKMFMASLIADCDRTGTLATVRHLQSLAASDSQLTIVPAHDGAVWDAIGYLPTWVT